MTEPFIHSRSREEQAAQEVGRTHMTRGTALMLLAGFLATIIGWSFVQWIYHPAPRRESGWGFLSPFLTVPKELTGIWQNRGGASALDTTVLMNRTVLKGIRATESRMDADSWLTSVSSPYFQAILYRILGAGNEEVYPGRYPWLFYRPDLDYLTGPGFLEQTHLRRRISEIPAWQPRIQPDPLKAIRSFYHYLKSRHIELVLLPVPVKPGIHPEFFHSGYKHHDHPLQNPSFEQWRTLLEQEGIKVVDPSPTLHRAAREKQTPMYLATDTHWRPEAMDEIASLVAAEIKPMIARTEESRILRQQAGQVTGRGDLALMLTLPDAYKPEPESVDIFPVSLSNQQVWRADPQSPVLLLGDSFSNIYSIPGMGWGASAGFAEQLSVHLGIPVDRLVRNDHGAWATRQFLAQERARGRDRLAGKRVVIWQFAARELAFGDWREIEFTIGEAPDADAFLHLDPKETIVVTGTVVSVSSVPVPGSVPYRDHILTAHITDITAIGNNIDQTYEAVVYLWSMKDNRLQPAASLRSGQTITLKLSAWSVVAEDLESINRSEPEDPSLLWVEPVWGEMLTP